MARVHWAVLPLLLLQACTASLSGDGQPTQNGGLGDATPGANGGSSTTGGSTDPGTMPNPDPTPEQCAAQATADPGPAYSRRLTRGEYDNTVADLLGDTTKPATSGTVFPPEELSLNFDNAPAALTVSPVLAQAYFDTAEALAKTALGASSPLLPCAASAGRSCAEQFVASFGAKAFRRPITPEESTRYLKVFDAGAQSDFQTGIRLAASAMLQSAPFLWRLEFGAGKAANNSYLKLSSYEMASRLSYLLWRSMPDDELTKAAAANQLETPAQIEAQARRMLSAPRLRGTVIDFHSQWLGLRKLSLLEKDKQIFPKFNANVASDMRVEIESFVGEVLLGATPNASQLFTANFSLLNQNLAAYYGLQAPGGSGFQRVGLDPKRSAGLLTLGGILAENAKSNQTSPVLRGKFVRTQLLCEPLNPPPAGVDTAVPDISATATTRERFEQHKTNPSCAGCHKFMDPIGLSFENFDAAGIWRDQDAGQPVDASGEVVSSDVSGPFNGAAELGQKLAQSAQVKACLVKNWYRYANGRTEADADACALVGLGKRFADSSYDVKELLVALTQSDAFLYRRDNAQGAAQ